MACILTLIAVAAFVAAGKSTILRQNALIVILAQSGLYVPATSAVFDVVDAVLCRVGAHDDIYNALSTFMVEMQETAYILHHATARSLCVFDELGRGTSTTDGLAIAAACLEHIHDVLQCRCLFATHFTVLAERLASRLPAMKPMRVAIATTQKQTRRLKQSGNSTLQQQQQQQPVTTPSSDSIVTSTSVSSSHDGSNNSDSNTELVTTTTITFLHKLEPGVSEQSYGVHVAAMAGLPIIVVERAAALLLQSQLLAKQQQLQLKQQQQQDNHL